MLKKVKYKYAPCDCPEEVQEIVDDILQESGGNNCVMHLFDTLRFNKLLPKYKLQDHIDKVYKLDVKEKF